MVGGAIVDVVVVDLHTPAVVTVVRINTVVIAVCVRSLRHRQDRNGQDHQEHQTLP
jgi:hypothetical protein